MAGPDIYLDRPYLKAPAAYGWLFPDNYLVVINKVRKFVPE